MMQAFLTPNGSTVIIRATPGGGQDIEVRGPSGETIATVRTPPVNPLDPADLVREGAVRAHP
ncbi:hypothetical protein OG196_15265 [Kitasatospora purpeofusca]|uniref:hypothetical protein n=1 Tax=Kitasatospora purpeofusca TaxID=67352 RepID=UPI002E118217|nr:hypothetical protein OG196_15265 [Kitasatospora purpeofusca]